MIDFTEIVSGETWELFARDFLSELGFYIESSPDRGADAGKDILASEELAGNLGQYRFRWLVSCKHNAVSGKAVNETDEQNILERIRSFDADGFIGFYSTVPSAALNTRLHSLRENGTIRDYRIFDRGLIENHLIRVGYSFLLLRYFPEGYKSVRPLHQLVSEYIPLECKVCDKDLLVALYDEEYKGLVAFVRRMRSYEEHDDQIEPDVIEEIYWACKGSCDRLLQHELKRERKVTTWDDISDLVIPIYFLKFVLNTQNAIRSGSKVFSEVAYNQAMTLIIALGQKVLRETTAKERERVGALFNISDLFDS
jgi:hypothetical protein